MSKTVKIVSIILVAIMLVMFFSTNVMAAGDIISGLQPDYKADGQQGLTNIGKQIINIISTVAIVVAVIVLLVIGIKYMIGSASEKAEYKKTMIPYLVGAILIFGAAGITQVIVNMASGIKV